MATAPRSSQTASISSESCPADCKQDRENFRSDVRELFGRTVPRWISAPMVGLMITSIIALYALYGSQWVYSSQTYATKTEVKDLKVDLKEQMNKGFAQILAELKDLNR